MLAANGARPVRPKDWTTLLAEIDFQGVQNMERFKSRTKLVATIPPTSP